MPGKAAERINNEWLEQEMGKIGHEETMWRKEQLPSRAGIPNPLWLEKLRKLIAIKAPIYPTDDRHFIYYT